MENEMDYLVADENCRIALRELMFTTLKTNWLKGYTKLYKKVSVQPSQDLPNIANANFDGVNYPFLGEFLQGSSTCNSGFKQLIFIVGTKK